MSERPLTPHEEAALLTDTSASNGDSDYPDPDQTPGDLTGADVEADQ